MIRDEELLHGAALVRLIESDESTRTTFDFEKELHMSLYRIGRGSRHVGVLMKVSTQRKSPWGFTFTSAELQAIDRYRAKFPRDEFFFALVCNRDGICCVPLPTAESLIDDGETLDGKRLGVRRPRGGSYWITGPRRTAHERSIPMNDWPLILFEEDQE